MDNSWPHWLRAIGFVSLWLLPCTVATAAEPLLQLVTFRVDVTPPIGDGPCVGCMPKVTTIEHPLELRGVVLKADSRTFVIAAIDYCGICNTSDETIRDAMARAAGTTRGRVALQSLHQHSAPILDADAVRLLHGEKSEQLAQHLKFTDDIASRTAAAIEVALKQWRPVTRISGTKAKVDRVASNRRVPQPDGSIAVRASFTREAAVREAPEGLIDPWLRTLTFFDGEQPLVQLHYYATHPQTFYGDARVSWDCVGMARERLEQATGTFQIYFTGCGGNVTVGKYNDGSSEAREQLATRLLEAMRRATDVIGNADAAKVDSAERVIDVDVTRLTDSDIDWATAPIQFTVREDGAFNPELLKQQLAPDVPFQTRLTAAMYSGFSNRLRGGYVAQASRLRIGDIDLLHLPGEPFVEFQLFAQQTAPPSSFVCVAGYGECGVWYYGPDRIYTDRGGYEQTWSVTGPCQPKVEAALRSLVAREVATASRHWLIRVDPVDIGQRPRDELPAEALIEVGEHESLDLTTIRIVRADAEGRVAGDATSLPFRWYDAAIPYDFPEFQDSVSRTAGKLQPQPRERGGYYLNAMGDGRKGRLAWMHMQVGQQPSWYVVEAKLLAAGAVPKHMPPQGWIGDGQARCAETATQAVHSDHLRIDLHDWNGDELIDLLVGDDFGHLTWWPNLGTKQSPKFEYSRLIFDADSQPIDVGIVAAPKLCDWDHDGDLDLLIGTERNRIVWYENDAFASRATSNRSILAPTLRSVVAKGNSGSTDGKAGARIRQGEEQAARLESRGAFVLADASGYWKYSGLVMLDGQPLELPVTPLTRGEPAIFKLDYYPVLEFVDWDGDGDNDLLAGGYITGCVFLYETVAAERGSPPKLVARGPLEADGKVLNVGHWCASPCAVDLDDDGDLDLLSGHTPMREPGMKAGIRYFENVGSKISPKLRTAELKTDQLWSITLGSPRTADWDGDGDLDLVIAVRNQLLLLENAGSKASPKFDKPPVSILPKWGPAPIHADQLLDWDGDGRVDLVSGFTVRLNGGAANPWDWPKTINLLPPGTKIEHRSGRGDEEHSTLLDDFDRDGAIDVLFGDWFGHVWLHRNRGTSAKPDFDPAGVKLLMTNGSPIKVGPIGGDPKTDFTALQGARTVIAAGDYNGDGLRDLIVGDTFGKVRYFRQAKFAEAPFAERAATIFAEGIEIGDLGIRLNVCATDWDQDGKLDVIAGSANGKVQVFLNAPRDGNASPFAAGFTPKLPPIMQPRVLLGDLNGDGDDDLYFPSTQGTCFVERSFVNHGYARGTILKRD